MDKIKKIKALEILDSRGNPTVQVTITSEDGLQAKASVPSGASTGVHEALELRDNDNKRYYGKGVLKAVNNINTYINNNLIGERYDNIEAIDKKMLQLDGTDNKSNLGANAILGVSLAVARLAALANKQPLYKFLRQFYNFDFADFRIPTPLSNVINGGRHADSDLAWQEFWIIPAGLNKYPQALRACSEIYHALAKELNKNKLATNVGDEGGYAPNVKSATQVWEMMAAAVAASGYKLGIDIFFGLDAGSSEFYNQAKLSYDLKSEGKFLSADQIIALYKNWLTQYPILAIEDGLAEDDWDGWKMITADKIIKQNKTILIGDDLFTTNTKRLQQGITLGIANSILIKPNQIGSLSETMAAIRLAQKHNYQIAISHRSGETADDFIADLAVAVNAEWLKIGATARGERIAKYNRLLEIYNELNEENK